MQGRDVDKTVETIKDAAKTGGEGDGLIIIYPVDEAVRIRTGERGPEALTYEGDIDSRFAKYYAPPHRGERGEGSNSTDEVLSNVDKGIISKIRRKLRD